MVLPQGRKLTRPAERLKQSVGQVRLGLVDLVIRTTQLFLGSAPGRDERRDGRTARRAWRWASSQSKPHQRGPGRTNLPNSSRVRSRLETVSCGSPVGPAAGSAGAWPRISDPTAPAIWASASRWTASNSQSSSRDSAVATRPPSGRSAARAPWPPPRRAGSRPRPVPPAPAGAGSPQRPARIASALSGSNWRYFSGRPGRSASFTGVLQSISGGATRWRMAWR